MKKLILFLLAVSSLSLSGCGKTDQVMKDQSVNMSVREISLDNLTKTQMLNEVRSAVVGISVDLTDGYAIGSGVAITSGGYILTNNHVIEDGKDITLYFADKTTGKARLLWADPGIDLAVLKSSKEIPYLKTSSLTDIDVGDEVYAIGTPLTLSFKHTVTKGIVSAKNRTLETQSNSGASFLQSLIQHDASINPGNSGGPIVNSKGEVCGINTLKASEGEGIGFAIPIEIGQVVVNQLSKNNSYRSAYLGVFGFDMDIAQIYGQNVSKNGVYVISVSGPASSIGLKKGDVITAIDDVSINSMYDLRVCLLKKSAGEEVLVGFEREGDVYTKTVKLAQK